MLKENSAEFLSAFDFAGNWQAGSITLAQLIPKIIYKHFHEVNEFSGYADRVVSNGRLSTGNSKKSKTFFLPVYALGGQVNERPWQPKSSILCAGD